MTTQRARAATAGLAVLAVTGGGFAFAGAASASTEPVKASLSAPTALTPDDEAAPQPGLKTVRLDWASVPGASGYRVQVGTDSTWSDTPALSQDVVSSEFTLPVWLPHSTYVWRVAALQGASLGHWSSESTQPQAEAQFARAWRDAPVPTPVSSPFEGRPTFAWSPVDAASGYQLQVSTDPSFASNAFTGSPGTQNQASTVLDNCFTSRTRVTASLGRAGANGSVGDCIFTAPASDATLYWRVRALDRFVGAAVPVDTTPVSTAGISHLPPAPVTTNVELTTDCLAPSGPPAVGAFAENASPTTSGTPCTVAAPSESAHWSAVSSFTYAPIDHSAETYAPSLVTTASLASDPDMLCTAGGTTGSPGNAVCKDVPTLRWSRVPGAARYRLYIALDEDFTNISSIVETSALQFTPTGSWRDSSPRESYYYAVQACDASSCGPVAGTPSSFQKVSSRPTLGATPAARGDFTLRWQSYAQGLAAATKAAATQDAYAYHLQVASADHPSYDVLVDEATVDQTSYVAPDKIYPDGQYVWRVQAVDSAGHKLPWSLSQGFSRDATPPRVATVLPNSRVAVTQAIKITFSEPVSGLSATTLTLNPPASATVSTFDNHTATLAPTRPLLPGSTYTVQVSPAVHDLAGNSAVAVGPQVSVDPLVDNTSKAMWYAGTWRQAASTNAVGGSYMAALPRPTALESAGMNFRGTAVQLTACLGPANGIVDLYVDSVRRARVSTYRSYSGCGVRIAGVSGLTRTEHVLRLVAIAAHAAGSRGDAVGLDALTVTP